MSSIDSSDQLNVSFNMKSKQNQRRKSRHQKQNEYDRYGTQNVTYVDGNKKTGETVKKFLVWKDPWPAVSSKLPPVTKTVIQNCWEPITYELEFSPVPTGKGPQYLYEVKGWFKKQN